MISSVRGTVLTVSGTVAVIEVGGVGLGVQVTPQHGLSLRIGQEAMVYTALIVREDDLSLFGFATPDELTVFDLLRGVSGVGPKSALGVLGTLSPVQIAQAVSAEDDAPFRKVTGIGPKTAKLIVVSLAGKLIVPSGAVSTGSTSGAGSTSVTSSVIGALVGLGWNDRVAAQAVEEAADEASAQERGSVQALLRLALARLGPQRTGANS
ncbi:MAG: Holliday junction branch migration protein RuvA [Actinomycetota bacterium]|nr:Holliday junction branch migration protein RuvA [Actinomycetota bacterium]